MAEVWRCDVCKKVKDLKGPHLNGKTSVRSDCWPCGKKRTFVKTGADSTTAAATTYTFSTTTTAKSTVNTNALPASISVTPSTEAQAAAFQNIFAAATAAAAAAAKTSTSSAITTSPPSFPFSSISRDGINNNSSSSSSSKRTSHVNTSSSGSTRGGADGGGVATAFGTSRTSSSPFITPAVSAASIKKFKTSYASHMTCKHEDPTPASEAGRNTSTFPPSMTSPYVMESSAGTSPPFTFRPNANYTPTSSTVGGMWSTATLLPGSMASLGNPSAAGRTVSPFMPSAESKPSTEAADAAASAYATLKPAVLTAAAADAPSTSDAATLVWACEHCHKVKDLKGEHLRGKTTVRSDCWPCAKKRTFVLTTLAALAAAGRSMKLGGGSGSRSSSMAQRAAVGGDVVKSPSRAISTAAQSQGPLFTAAVAASAAPTRFENLFTGLPRLATPPKAAGSNTEENVSPPLAENAGSQASPKPVSWVKPVIPADANADESFFIHPEATLSSPSPSPSAQLSLTSTVPIAHEHSTMSSHGNNSAGSAAPLAVSSSASWVAAVAASTRGTESDLATYYAAMARFDQQLLKSFRERLVGGVQLRAVWHERVLYVIAEDAAAAAAEPDDLVGAFAELGRYAALYLAVEQKLAASRFRHVGRLFCPNEFAFAAACCYANNFFPSEAATTSSSSLSTTLEPTPGSAKASRFKVYGPQMDPTKSLSLWGRIVSASPAAQLCVVSEEQRVVAAQTLYRRVSWLAAPQTMTATAIQLSVEAASAADEHGVDVVLLTGTMKLEELPQAVPLAQLPQPYAC